MPNYVPMGNELATLGKAIRDRRQQLRLSQREAAHRADFSNETWRKAEAGHPVAERTLAYIEQVLEWPAGTVDAILAGQDPPADWLPRPDVSPEEQSRLIDLERRIAELEREVIELRRQVGD